MITEHFINNVMTTSALPLTNYLSLLNAYHHNYHNRNRHHQQQQQRRRHHHLTYPILDFTPIYVLVSSLENHLPYLSYYMPSRPMLS